MSIIDKIGRGKGKPKSKGGGSSYNRTVFGSGMGTTRNPQGAANAAVLGGVAPPQDPANTLRRVNLYAHQRANKFNKGLPKGFLGQSFRQQVGKPPPFKPGEGSFAPFGTANPYFNPHAAKYYQQGGQGAYTHPKGVEFFSPQAIKSRAYKIFLQGVQRAQEEQAAAEAQAQAEADAAQYSAPQVDPYYQNQDAYDPYAQ